MVSELGSATLAKVRRIMDVVLDAAIGPVIVALGRPGSPLFTRDDLAFAHEVMRACATRNVDCLGVYVASGGAVREVPDALRRAS